jgi:hypothetical protein
VPTPDQLQARRFVEQVAGLKPSAPAGGGPPIAPGYPNLGEFEEKLKGDKPATFTRKSPGGAPFLRKQDWVSKYLMANKDPYLVTGRLGSKIRTGGGTLGWAAVPALAWMLGKKVMPSDASRVLADVEAKRRKQLQ